jgi:hypothetical protein
VTIRRQVVRMLLRSGGHAIGDGDPIHWLWAEQGEVERYDIA